MPARCKRCSVRSFANVILSVRKPFWIERVRERCRGHWQPTSRFGCGVKPPMAANRSQLFQFPTSWTVPRAESVIQRLPEFCFFCLSGSPTCFFQSLQTFATVHSALVSANKINEWQRRQRRRQRELLHRGTAVNRANKLGMVTVL